MKTPVQILANYFVNEIRYLANKHKISVIDCIKLTNDAFLRAVCLCESKGLLHHGRGKELIFENFYFNFNKKK